MVKVEIRVEWRRELLSSMFSVKMLDLKVFLFRVIDTGQWTVLL